MPATWGPYWRERLHINKVNAKPWMAWHILCTIVPRASNIGCQLFWEPDIFVSLLPGELQIPEHLTSSISCSGNYSAKNAPDAWGDSVFNREEKMQGGRMAETAKMFHSSPGCLQVFPLFILCLLPAYNFLLLKQVSWSRNKREEREDYRRRGSLLDTIVLLMTSSRASRKNTFLMWTIYFHFASKEHGFFEYQSKESWEELVHL